MPSYRYFPAFVTLTLSVTLLSSGRAQERPATGSGILAICPLLPGVVDSEPGLTLYRHPGAGRIAPVEPTSRPALVPALALRPACLALAVTEKRGSWFKVIHDDAGREGWIRGKRSWRYDRWPDYLVGRRVVPLSKAPAGQPYLRTAPLDQSPTLARFKPGEARLIREVRDDWAATVESDGSEGWFRWRDGNGRLLISVSAVTE